MHVKCREHKLLSKTYKKSILTGAGLTHSSKEIRLKCIEMNSKEFSNWTHSLFSFDTCAQWNKKNVCYSKNISKQQRFSPFKNISHQKFNEDFVHAFSDWLNLIIQWNKKKYDVTCLFMYVNEYNLMIFRWFNSAACTCTIQWFGIGRSKNAIVHLIKQNWCWFYCGRTSRHTFWSRKQNRISFAIAI